MDTETQYSTSPNTYFNPFAFEKHMMPVLLSKMMGCEFTVGKIDTLAWKAPRRSERNSNGFVLSASRSSYLSPVGGTLPPGLGIQINGSSLIEDIHEALPETIHAGAFSLRKEPLEFINAYRISTAADTPINFMSVAFAPKSLSFKVVEQAMEKPRGFSPRSNIRSGPGSHIYIDFNVALGHMPKEVDLTRLDEDYMALKVVANTWQDSLVTNTINGVVQIVEKADIRKIGVPAGKVPLKELKKDKILGNLLSSRYLHMFRHHEIAYINKVGVRVTYLASSLI